jgi:hypothetical protein
MACKIYPLSNYKFNSSTTEEDTSLSSPYDKEAIGLALSGPRLSLFAVLLIEEKSVPHVIVLQSTSSPDIYSLYKSI